MKNRVFILSFLISMISVNFVFAQTSTKKLSYQAVVRNAANELVVNQNLAVEITVLDAENAPQYKETHPSVPTNQNGLLWLWVGEGSPTLGTMADVVWKDAVIRSVFTLPDGSTVTQNTPVTAMPYAYFADEVDTIFLQNYLDTHDVVPDNYVTHPQLNDTLDHYYTKGNVDNKLNDYEKKSELCGDVKECIKDTLGKYTTSNQIDTLLGAYYDSTQVKTAIHDTADAIRAAIPASQVNADWNATGGPAEILNKPDLSVYATTNALKDSLTRYVDKDKLTDTLDSYYTKNNIDNKLNDYEKKSELCGDVKECIKDTLGKYTTTNQIDTLLGAYYDTTHTKSVISDTATALRAMMGDAAYNSKITLKKNNVELDSFRLNQQTDKAINIPVPTTVAELSDAGDYVTKEKLNDTLGAYYDTANVKQMLKPYLKANELCDSILKCDVIKDMRDSLGNAFDTLKYYYTSKKINDTLKAYYDTTLVQALVHDSLDKYVLKTAVRDSITNNVNLTVKHDSLFLTHGNGIDTVPAGKMIHDSIANRVHDGKLTLIKTAGDTTKLFTANQATNDTLDLSGFYDTTHVKKAIHDSLTQNVELTIKSDSLFLKSGGDIDTVKLPAVPEQVKSDWKETNTSSAAYILNKPVIKDSVNIVVKDSLGAANSAINKAIDSIARHHISDSTRMVFDTLHKYYATKKALKDTATAIRNDICDSASTCITKALADANSEINHAVDTIARNNIHDTAVAIRALIPTVPTNVSAFTNDAKYVNNASCDSLDFCALMAKVNALANSMGEFNNTINNTINDMQHTIDSLEGVIDALSSLLPKVTLTTDQTTVPIGSGDVASVICTATLKNANSYTLYWNVDGTDSTSNHNTPFTVNFTTVGTHKIVCTAKQEDSPDIKDSVTITITKGTPTVNVTMPTGLVYTGAPQALVTAGSTTGGTLQYKLNDGAYSTDIPEASAVGSYTVSYKVVGNDNWNDVDETSEDVTIAKMPINPTVSITGWTSCEPANIPSVTGNTGNAPVTYEYKVNGADDNTYGATIPVSAGEYTIRATVAETANYSAGVATADFTIAAGSGCEEPSGTPATILVAPTATPGTITSGTTTPLVTEGQAENGTMMYAVTTSAQPQLSDFSTTVPTAAALTAGTCYVWYYAQGIIPYINSPIAGPIEVTVTPPPFSVGSNKKVYFAPANLQASTSDYGANWTWHFAANPWNYNGDGSVKSDDRYYHNERINGNGTVKNSGAGTVDQFGWVGASNTAWEGELGTTLNAAMYGISNSWNNSDYGNVSGESLKSDWGNTINDGYNWRTLTSAEWSYLLASRASGSTVPGKIKNSDLSYTNITVNNARYTLARINIDATPVNGMIIFPDGITIDESEITQRGYINREIGNTMYDTWEDGTKCTTEQWAALAAKGCVFLPMGGAYRHKENANTPVFQPGTSAGYWSSSPVNATQAYFVSISKSYVDPRSSDNLISNDDRRRGHMVRLVRDAE